MKIFLLSIAFIIGLMIYVAWLNGFFRRCPHCHRFRPGQFERVGPVSELRDEDGVVWQRAQKCNCRLCGGQLIDIWSDGGGRRLEKSPALPGQ